MVFTFVSVCYTAQVPTTALLATIEDYFCTRLCTFSHLPWPFVTQPECHPHVFVTGVAWMSPCIYLHNCIIKQKMDVVRTLPAIVAAWSQRPGYTFPLWWSHLQPSQSGRPAETPLPRSDSRFRTQHVGFWECKRSLWGLAGLPPLGSLTASK